MLDDVSGERDGKVSGTEDGAPRRGRIGGSGS